jgi:hypothetical protein
VTPIDAAKAEACAELDALQRRLRPGEVPDVIVIRIETDRQSGMPRAVHCHEERSRRIIGGALPARAAGRCKVAS